MRTSKQQKQLFDYISVIFKLIVLFLSYFLLRLLIRSKFIMKPGRWGGGGGGGRFTKTGHSPFSSLCSAALRHNKQEMQTGTKADVTTDHLWSGVLVNIRNW